MAPLTTGPSPGPTMAWKYTSLPLSCLHAAVDGQFHGVAMAQVGAETANANVLLTPIIVAIEINSVVFSLKGPKL